MKAKIKEYDVLVQIWISAKDKKELQNYCNDTEQNQTKLMRKAILGIVKSKMKL